MGIGAWTDGSENSADSHSSEENEPQRQSSLFRGRTLLKRRSSGNDSLNKRKRAENTPSSESDFEKTDIPLDAADEELFLNEKETQVSGDLDDVLDDYVGTGPDDPTQPPNYCSQVRQHGKSAGRFGKSAIITVSPPSLPFTHGRSAFMYTFSFNAYAFAFFFFTARECGSNESKEIINTFPDPQAL